MSLLGLLARGMDYWSKLSPEEKKNLKQFMMEYYQADFQYDETLHPEHLRKDCTDRNNRIKRQIDAIESDTLNKAADGPEAKGRCDSDRNK